MKRLLSISLALAMVFSLMSAFTLLVGAETLSPNWTELTPWDVDGSTNIGEVAVVGNSIVLKVPEGGWWPQAGVKFADMVDVDGLEITFNANAFTYEFPNGYFAITLSDKPLGDFGVPGIVGARAWGATSSGNALTFTFHSSNLEMLISNGVSDDWATTTKAGANKDVTISFHDTMDGLRMKVNGKDVKQMIENEDEELEEVDLIIPEGEYVSGQAYLSFSAVGYGGSGCDAIAIKTINGQPANQYENQCPNGHLFSDYIVIKAPTCAEPGYKDRVCTVCGQSEHNGKSGYEVVIGSYSWSEAKSLCEKMGGHLACITSVNEQYEIEKISNGKRLWIGLYRDDDFNWNWVTGEPLEYLNWDDGEPNNSSNVVPNENCAAIWPYYWNDLNNNNLSEQSGFICEYEYELIPALDHTFGEWTVIKEPTIFEEGIETRTCRICHTNETKMISKISTLYDCVLNNGEITITKYKGPGGDIYIPSMISGYPVTEIGQWAFYDCNKVKSVTIPEGVKKIGYEAFYCNTGIETIVLPESLEQICCAAFAGCINLKSVTVKSHVKKIESAVFAGCTSLKAIVLPNVEEIEERAFYDCVNLTDITISIDNFPNLCAWCFKGCRNIKNVMIIHNGQSVNVSENIDIYASVANNIIIFLGSKTSWENVKNNYSIDERYDNRIVFNSCTSNHTLGKKSIEKNINPTCTDDGHYDEVIYCANCGAELSRKTINVKALGHTPGEAVKENEVEPTYSTAGSYDLVVYCSVCGEELSRETVTVPALVAPGDLTGDGELTDSDVLYLLYHVFFPNTFPLSQNCDFTGDGDITDSDVIYLLYHIYFPEDYPIA